MQNSPERDHQTTKNIHKFFSGKKQRHTFKNQFVSLPKGEDIVDVIVGERGPEADVNLLRQQQSNFADEQSFTGDQADLVSGSEQDALAEYLSAFFNQDNGQSPFTQEDTPEQEDERIQNLEVRSDTIFEGLQPKLPKNVFGTPDADLFDAENPDDKQFLGEEQNLFAGSGDDYVDVTFAPGGNRIDLGSGDDYLFAGTNNHIIAGSGDDTLFVGSAGGNNVITGGSGMDQFWIVTDSVDLSTQTNTITDFTIGEDVIGLGSTNLSFADLDLIQDGSSTVVNALNQDLAILRNTQASALSASDFVVA